MIEAVIDIIDVKHSYANSYKNDKLGRWYWGGGVQYLARTELGQYVETIETQYSVLLTIGMKPNKNIGDVQRYVVPFLVECVLLIIGMKPNI